MISKDRIFTGSIPEGKTFDATCTYEKDYPDNSKDKKYKYVFNSDGTLSYEFLDAKKREQKVSGTYERDGSIISFYYNNIDSELLAYTDSELLIYEDMLSGVSLYKYHVK